MKKLVFISLLFCSIFSFGQTIDPSTWIQNNGSFNYLNWKVRGNQIIPVKNDTTNKVPGLIQLIGNNFYWVGTDGKWHTSIGSIYVDSTTDELIKGGVVTYHGTGLTFDVTKASYYINGSPYSSAAGQVTLGLADNHFNRFDVIAVDRNGAIVVVPGTPGLNPVAPQVDPSNQLYLTSVYVAAGATTPTTIANNIIYNEDVPPDWVVSGSGITFDPNNTTSPYNGNIAISTNSWINGGKISLQNNNVVSLTQYNVLKFYLKLKVAVPSTSDITVTFLNNTTAVSNTIGISYDKSLVGQYQNVSIPFSSLIFSGATFNTIAIGFNGNNSAGVYIDYVQLQNGIIQASGGVQTFKGRTGNVIPMPGDYSITDITGLSDSLAAKQNKITFGDTTQYIRGDGSLGTMLIPERDSISFTTDFRNLGTKGYPIIGLKPNGVPVGTFPNATVTTDSSGRIVNVVAGSNSSGVTTETDPVFLASVAHSITSTDITNWNNKLSSYTETDPVFLASVAHSITSTNIANWNTAFSTLGSLSTVATTGSYNDLLNKPVIPQGVSSITLNTPAIIYTNPATFTNTNGAWSATLTPISQTANTVFAAPNGSNGTPSFRLLAATDIPALPESKIINLTTDLSLKLNITDTAAMFAAHPSSTGGTTQVTSYQTTTATAAQTAFTFTGVPSTLSDYQVHRNGVYIDQAFYTVSGNTITFITGLQAGDVVTFHRVK